VTVSEQDWIDGNRAAYLRMLQECLRELGVDDPAAGQARWVVEREATIVMLRQVCERFGDNEWQPELHLADIIEKYLWRNLEASSQ
jgi:hypothetical protein